MTDSGETVWKTPASPLTTREEIQQHLRPPPWRRLAITLLAPIVYFALTRIPLPLLGEETLSLLATMPAYDPASTSICALGITPVLSAFYVVEVVALLVPRWNNLRTAGHEGRRKLLFATYALAFVFTVIQSWTVATELAGFSGNAAIIPVTVACHVVVTALLIGLAMLIDRRGLGGGYAVLIGAAAAPVGYGLFWSAWVAVRRNLLDAIHIAMIIVLLGGVVMIAAYLLKLGRTQVPGLVVRVPASGLVPLGIAAALLTLPSDSIESLHPAAPLYWIAYLVLSVILSVALSWLFNRPTLVGDTVSHVTGADREQLWDHARAQLGAVTMVSASLIAGIVLVSGFIGWLVSGALFVDVALAVVITALVLDLISEWRFRRMVPDAVSAWPMHRVYAVAPALLALERAGIPAHARSLRQRTLYQFFGPEVPIDLMVPADRIEDAKRALSEAMLQKNHIA